MVKLHSWPRIQRLNDTKNVFFLIVNVYKTIIIFTNINVIFWIP